MRLIKKYGKVLCVVMSLLFLMQSCSFYNFKSSTLDEAVESKKRVKVVTKSGNRMRFKKLISIDGNYYGIKRKDSFLIRVDDIQKIKLKNTTVSIILSVTGIGIIIFLAVGIATFSPNISPNATFTPPQ